MRELLWLAGLWLIASIGALCAELNWETAPRVLAGFVLAMLAPGYALLTALRPRGMAPAERISLSVPLSLAIAALTGVVVDQTPLGLNQTPILLGLWAITSICAVVAAARLRRADTESRNWKWPAPASWLRWSVAGVSLLLAGGWAFTSLADAARTTPQPFTALAIDNALDVTIENHEQRPVRYELEERIDNNVVWRADAIQIDSGGQLSQPLAVAPASGQTAEILLYHEGDPTVYRQLHVGAQAAS